MTATAVETQAERQERFRDGGRLHIFCRPNQRVIRRSCFNSDDSPKVRWPNPTSARFVARLAEFRRARRGQSPKFSEAYYCGFCTGWHVGSPPAPQWFHTMPERHPELMGELGVRAVAVMWQQNADRIRQGARRRKETAPMNQDTAA